jgi:predicted nucleotidyltransferase component of viral defense system
MNDRSTTPTIAELAEKLGFGDDQIAREILQAQLLSALFQNRARKELILKGGLAMRHVYRSHRMTKGLDLSAAAGATIETMKATVSRALVQTVALAARTGILDDAKISAPKQTETTQRWKLNGRIAGSDSLVQLTVEVSRRGTPPDALVDSVPVEPIYGAPAAVVHVFKPIAMAAGKVAALTDPKRDAPRDVWDLDLLIEMRVEPPIDLLSKMGKRTIDEALATLWPKLDAMDFSHVIAELRAFLPRPLMNALTEDEWTMMRTRVGDEVESWLKAARRAAPDDEGKKP